MKKPFLVIGALVLFLGTVYFVTGGSRKVPKEKAAQIEHFLKIVAGDTLEQDYRRHGMDISAAITRLSVNRITKERTPDYIKYTAMGSVSYIIKGKRVWQDKEGNAVRLDPEQEVTHWFSCGVLEDGYGELLKDPQKPLTFFAENPAP